MDEADSAVDRHAVRVEHEVVEEGIAPFDPIKEPHSRCVLAVRLVHNAVRSLVGHPELALDALRAHALGGDDPHAQSVEHRAQDDRGGSPRTTLSRAASSSIVASM